MISAPSPLNVSVRLHWNDPNDSNIDLYQFRYKSDGDFNSWAEIPNSGATTTDHTVTSLSNSIEYTFEVRAIDSDRAEGDQAGPASSATATPTTAARAPSQMSNVQHTVTGVTNGGGGTVSFTWDNPSEGFITKYQYRYDPTSSNPGEGNWDQDWIDAPGDDSNNKDMVTFSRLIPGSNATVFFELRAINGTPTEPLNGPASVVRVDRSNTPDTSPAPPAAPTGLTATATPGQVKLDWTIGASSDNITGYEYRQSSSQNSDGNAIWNPDWTEIGSSDASTITHTVSSLRDGTAYTFELRANNSVGDGGAASVGPVTPGAPNAPTGLSATPTNDDTTDNVNEAETQVVLSWTAGADITGVEVDDYEYRMRVGGTVSYGEWMSTGLASVPTADNPFTVIVKFPSTTYYFQVRAKAGSLASDPSDAVSAKTDVPAGGILQPEPPTNLRAAAGDEQVTLNWSQLSPGEVKWYRVRWFEGSDASSGEWQQVPGTGATMTHTVTDLTNGTTYSFQVKAVGAGDDNVSTASNTATATPRVRRPAPPPSGPTPDSVTATNGNGSVSVTVIKLNNIDVAITADTDTCGTQAVGNDVSLCVQIDASGAVDGLTSEPASVVIEVSEERWSSLRTAYAAGRFYVYKRSSPGSVWQGIPACQAGPTNECYSVAENSDGSATITISNITSFSQYAFVTASDGSSVGPGGSGTPTRPRRRARPTPTTLPIPTVEATATPDTPTPPPNTPTPPATVPTPEPPSPPPPTEAPVVEPTGTAPTEAPTGEPVVQALATEAPPSPTEAPGVTAVPPPVDTGGGFPGWLIAVIIVAVIVVAGLGYLAFRMFRQQ